MEFVCPEIKWVYDKEIRKSRRICHCETLCTGSSCGRMFYIYPEKNLCAYPGTIRGTDEWDSTYKIRVSVEKSINPFKDSFWATGRKNRNEKTLHADLICCLRGLHGSLLYWLLTRSISTNISMT